MPKTYVTDHNGHTRDVEVDEGRSLMEGLRAAGIAGIVADCGGACATCHVYIDEAWLERVGVQEPLGEDMLDFTSSPSDHRPRLSCQISVTTEHDGLSVHLPETQA